MNKRMYKKMVATGAGGDVARKRAQTRTPNPSPGSCARYPLADVIRNGWTSAKFMDVRWRINVVQPLPQDPRVYHFADAGFLGKSYLMEDTVMTVEREKFERHECLPASLDRDAAQCTVASPLDLLARGDTALWDSLKSITGIPQEQQRQQLEAELAALLPALDTVGRLLFNMHYQRAALVARMGEGAVQQAETDIQDLFNDTGRRVQGLQRLQEKLGQPVAHWALVGRFLRPPNIKFDTPEAERAFWEKQHQAIQALRDSCVPQPTEPAAPAAEPVAKGLCTADTPLVRFSDPKFIGESYRIHDPSVDGPLDPADPRWKTVDEMFPEKPS